MKPYTIEDAICVLTDEERAIVESPRTERESALLSLFIRMLNDAGIMRICVCTGETPDQHTDRMKSGSAMAAKVVQEAIEKFGRCEKHNAVMYGGKCYPCDREAEIKKDGLAETLRKIASYQREFNYESSMDDFEIDAIEEAAKIVDKCQPSPPNVASHTPCG